MVAGGMHGCQGVCIVAGGCAWLQGGHVWLWWACMAVGGVHGCGGQGVRGCGVGMRGCQGGMRGCGGHAWLWGGRGMRGCWGACVGHNEIWSMSGWYASYGNAFLYCENSYQMNQRRPVVRRSSVTNRSSS